MGMSGVPTESAAAGPRPGLPRALSLLLGGAAAVIIVAGVKAVAWLVAPSFLALVLVIVVYPVQDAAVLVLYRQTRSPRSCGPRLTSL